MRKTKIICTIGPASENEEVLTQMCLAGMNVARLNFSHGTHPEHEKKIELIKRVREKLNLPIAILLDTKGPEYRIKTFENGKIALKDGDAFTFTTDDIIGNEQRVSVTYQGLANDLNVGDRILLNNGLLIFFNIFYDSCLCNIFTAALSGVGNKICYGNFHFPQMLGYDLQLVIKSFYLVVIEL